MRCLVRQALLGLSRANRSLLWIVFWLAGRDFTRGRVRNHVVPERRALSQQRLCAGTNCGIPSKPDVLCWQGTDFVSPFLFDTRQIDAVYFPDPMKPERPVGQYCFELSAGDVVFGSLVSLTSKEAELDVPFLGRLRVPRNHLQRMTRKPTRGAWFIAAPMGSPTGSCRPGGAWQNEQGQLWTDRTTPRPKAH